MFSPKYLSLLFVLAIFGGSSHLANGSYPFFVGGISRVNPLITEVITHLVSGMNHQVSFLGVFPWYCFPKIPVNMGSAPIFARVIDFFQLVFGDTSW